MRRASFELFAEDLRRKGYSNKKIRRILEKMIEEGLAGGTITGVTSSPRGVLLRFKKESLDRWELCSFK